MSAEERVAQVVDDEAPFRRSLVLLLRSAGFVVRNFASGGSSRTVELHRANLMCRVGAKALLNVVRMARAAGFDPRPRTGREVAHG